MKEKVEIIIRRAADGFSLAVLNRSIKTEKFFIKDYDELIKTLDTIIN